MKEVEYSEAAAQVLDILNYTSQEDVRKIPESFIRFLAEIANKSYKAKVKYNGSISGLNLRKQTKELLGFMYITWWCNEKDRNNYKNIIYANNRRIDSYEIGDIFKNRKEAKKNEVAENEEKKETAIIKYEEESLWKSFFNKIVNFFKSKIERGRQDDK